MFFWIIFIALVVLFSLALPAWSFAPWAPTKRRDLERIMRLAAIKPGERFIELGCGNGRIVFEATRQGAATTGVELSPLFYFICLVRKFLQRDQKTTIRFDNLFTVDLSNANIIYFFGMPDKIGRLRQKLERELKPGTRVVSYVFPIDGWTPTVVDHPTNRDLPIYLYQK